MLVEFRVANHRSLLDEQAFTLSSTRGGDPNDPRPRTVKGYPDKLLPVAALYGANASGKSNVLAALRFVRDAVLESHRLWPPEGGVPRQAFAWAPPAPSTYEVTWVRDGMRHQYGFVADDVRFLEEWLYVWPSNRRQTWFTREGDTFTFGDRLLGENRAVQQFTRTNSLYLSAAAQNGHHQLGPLYAWFRSMRMVNVRGGSNRPGFHGVDAATTTQTLLLPAIVLPVERAPVDTDFDFSPTLKDLLRASDLGIEDVKIAEPSDRGPRVLIKHKGSDDARAWLPLEQESQGTQALFRVAPRVIDTLRDGGLLVVDELEASLHPLLGLHLVRLFNDPSTNPRHAQLVFSTHDTNLLGTMYGSPPLRRDQVWLTEKDEQGATRMYPLTDYKPRKAENLESGYLQGRYGAIPFLGGLADLPE
jgi:hypothetical protein